MKFIFTAKSSEEAFGKLRAIGVNKRIVLHRMPRCQYAFEALIDP